MVDVSVLIVNWNTRDLLYKCLKSLENTCQNLSYEIIVVDNGSGDGSLEMLDREFPQVLTVKNKTNAGFARANNQGLALARGKFALLLNSDTVVLEGALERMMDFMESHPGVGALGCRLLNEDGTLQYSAGNFPALIPLACECFFLDRLPGASRFLPTYKIYNREFYQRERQVDWVSGAALMVRRGAVAEAGGLDENYFMYVEEVDLCYRLKQLGYQVMFLPSVEIIHLNHGGNCLARRQAIVHTCHSLLYFYRKFFPGSKSLVLRGILAGGSLLRILLALGLMALPAKRELALDRFRGYLAVLRKTITCSGEGRQAYGQQ